jgi:hypothetical protein
MKLGEMVEGEKCEYQFSEQNYIGSSQIQPSPARCDT